MLSNGFARPLHLKRKPSRLLAGFFFAIHLLALVALLQPLALTLLEHMMLYAFLVLSSAYHITCFRRQFDNQEYWVWYTEGLWQYGDNEQLFTLVLSNSVQTPWFVSLTLAGFSQKQRLLFVRDQLDADTFRRLRVRIKFHHEDTAARSDEPV